MTDPPAGVPSGGLSAGTHRDGPRPLVVRVAALGDTILLTGMLRALSEIWRQPCDVVVHARWADSVLAGLDSVGVVLGLTSRTAPYWLCPSQRRLVQWLRRREPGPTYVVDNRREMSRLVRRGGVPERWAVTSLQHPWQQREHHLDYLLRLARRLPPAVDVPSARMPEPVPVPELRVSEAELDDCRRWLGERGWRGEPLVAIQTQHRKRRRGVWPADCWEPVIRQVAEDLGDVRVALVGAPHEISAVREVERRCAGLPVFNLAGELPVRRLFALLKLCHSCLSPDTGPAHAAAALGCPLVVLVCSTHPDEYRPVGPPHRVEQVCALAPECWPPTQAEFALAHRIEDIEPEQVVAAWRRVTASSAG